MDKSTKIAAVIVTYNPKALLLENLLHSVIMQVDSIYIIDNDSDKDIEALIAHNSKTLSVVKLSQNKGIAYAQNLGIELAKKNMMSHVLLLDQDSILTLGMVQHLMKGFDSDTNVAAIGPVRVDMRNQKSSFFLQNKTQFRLQQMKVEDISLRTYHEVVFLISSGSIISLDAIDDIGLMNCEYFIDNVDTEWAIRAKDKGYRLLGDVNAVLEHSLGDKAKEIWFWGLRAVPWHSPIRHYYVFRNTVLIFKDHKLSFAWKTRLISRLLSLFIFFMFLGDRRISRLKMMILGLKHGIQNIRGRLCEEKRVCESVSGNSDEDILIIHGKSG